MIPEKNSNFILLFFLIVLTLCIPLRSAYAALGLFELGTMQLDALDFVDNVILQIIIFLILLLSESIVFLAASANLLQWAISLPVNLGIANPLNNLLVSSGWQFTIGLVNLFFILIFIAIALAYILRIETFGAKRALPRLIIMALLINFSLIFVGFLVDVAWIFQRTILDAFGGDFVTIATGALQESSLNFYYWLVAIPIAAIASATIPYANVIALVILGLFFLAGEMLLGLVSKTFFLIIFNFAIGSILFLYFFLFLMRIGMIWILAILSPLAFVAYILPATKKYWDRWLHLLIEWLFMGFSALFLMGLGLKVFAEFPSGGVFTVEGFSFFPANIGYNYLFLLVYLGVAYYVSKRYTPEFAAALINQTRTLAGRGMPMFGRPAAAGFRRWLVEKERQRQDIEERKKAGEEIKRKERIERRAVPIIARPARWALKWVARTTPEAMESKEIARREDELTKRFVKDYKSAASIYSTLTSEGKVALAHYLQKTKGAQALGELSDEQFRETVRSASAYAPHWVEDLVKHKSDFIDETTARARAEQEARKRGITKIEEIAKIEEENERIAQVVQRTMVPKGFDDEDVDKLRDVGVEEADAIRKAAFKKAVDALRPTDIENLAVETFKNEDFQEMIVRFKNVNFIRRIGEEKGQEYIDLIHKKFEELHEGNQVAASNAILLRQSVTNPGFRAVFPAPREIRELEDDKSRLKKITELVNDARTEVEGRRRERREREAREEEGPPEETGEVGARRDVEETGEEGARRD